MVVVDRSAWIEYFNDGEPSILGRVDRCLSQDLVGIGDLVYCEVMQRFRSAVQRRRVSELLLALPRFGMVGFRVAEKGAANYRLLRTRGLTVRKTIDVLIETFCADNDLPLTHCDRNFDVMAPHIGLRTV